MIHDGREKEGAACFRSNQLRLSLLRSFHGDCCVASCRVDRLTSLFPSRQDPGCPLSLLTYRIKMRISNPEFAHLRTRRKIPELYERLVVEGKDRERLMAVYDFQMGQRNGNLQFRQIHDSPKQSAFYKPGSDLLNGHIISIQIENGHKHSASIQFIFVHEYKNPNSCLSNLSRAIFRI
jgi:hypothetical protein